MQSQGQTTPSRDLSQSCWLTLTQINIIKERMGFIRGKWNDVLAP